MNTNDAIPKEEAGYSVSAWRQFFTAIQAMWFHFYMGIKELLIFIDKVVLEKWLGRFCRPVWNLNERSVVYSMRYPRVILSLLGGVVLISAMTLVYLGLDTNSEPENMLAWDNKHSTFHREHNKLYDLNKEFVIALANKERVDGIFYPEGLKFACDLIAEIKTMTFGDKGHIIQEDIMALSTIESVEHKNGGKSRELIQSCSEKLSDDADKTVVLPKTAEQKKEEKKQASVVQQKTMKLKVIKGTIVNDDGTMMAIIVPISHKDISHDLYEKVKAFVDEKKIPNVKVYITGLAAIQGIFGYKMFYVLQSTMFFVACMMLFLLWKNIRNPYLFVVPMIVMGVTLLIVVAGFVAMVGEIELMPSMGPTFIATQSLLDSVWFILSFGGAMAWATREKLKQDADLACGRMLFHDKVLLKRNPLLSFSQFELVLNQLTKHSNIEESQWKLSVADLLRNMPSFEKKDAESVKLIQSLLSQWDDAKTPLIEIVKSSLSTDEAYTMDKHTQEIKEIEWAEAAEVAKSGALSEESKLAKKNALARRSSVIGGIVKRILFKILTPISELNPEGNARYVENIRSNSISYVARTKWQPMLLTSVTTFLGFISMVNSEAFPIQDYGIGVAVGMLVAFFVTFTFTPAYLMIIEDETIAKMFKTGGSKWTTFPDPQAADGDRVAHFFWFHIQKVAFWSRDNDRLVTHVWHFIFALSLVGVSHLKMNDISTNWFSERSEVRTDAEYLSGFGGIYPVKLNMKAVETVDQRMELHKQVVSLIPGTWKKELDLANNSLKYTSSRASYLQRMIEPLKVELADMEEMMFDGVAINFDRKDTIEDLVKELEGLQKTYLFFINPDILKWIEKFSIAMKNIPGVEKVNTLTTIVKDIHRDWEGKGETIPETSEQVLGMILAFNEGSKNPHQHIWHMVTKDFSETNLVIQSTSGDINLVSKIKDRAEEYISQHPLPSVEFDWFGLAVYNMYMMYSVVGDMIPCLLIIFIFWVMIFKAFRSKFFASLSASVVMMCSVIMYGFLGIFAIDVTMPIIVISMVSLSIAVDLPTHFLHIVGYTKKAWDVKIYGGRSGLYLYYNAEIVAITFLMMAFAPLTPYITVGVQMCCIIFIMLMIMNTYVPARLSLHYKGERMKDPDVAWYHKLDETQQDNVLRTYSAKLSKCLDCTIEVRAQELEKAVLPKERLLLTQYRNSAISQKAGVEILKK